MKAPPGSTDSSASTNPDGVWDSVLDTDSNRVSDASGATTSDMEGETRSVGDSSTNTTNGTANGGTSPDTDSATIAGQTTGDPFDTPNNTESDTVSERRVVGESNTDPVTGTADTVTGFTEEDTTGDTNIDSDSDANAGEYTDTVIETKSDSNRVYSDTEAELSNALPVIDAIDGDGSEKDIVDVDGILNDRSDVVEAQHRLRQALVVRGQHLDAITGCRLVQDGGAGAVFDEQDGLRFEETGGSPMQRLLHLPKMIIAGAFTLLFTAGELGTVEAQIYLLRGEPGDGLECDAGVCRTYGDRDLAVNGSVVVEGDVTATSGTFSRIEADSMSNEPVVQYADCPRGYSVRVGTDRDFVICEKEISESIYDVVVKVGDFWIDKFEMSIWPLSTCSGEQLWANGANDGPVAVNGVGSGGEVFGCSLANVPPSRGLTWFQAQQICLGAGKSLCTNAQWQAAAVGTPDPYDNSYEPVDRAFECHIFHNDLLGDPFGFLPLGGVWSDSPERTILTGSAHDCISNHGVNDMVGNVLEWVADWMPGGPTWMTSESGDTSPWPDGFNSDVVANVNGAAIVRPGVDGANNPYAEHGAPAAILRGGGWRETWASGVYSLNAGYAPSIALDSFGVRCCIGE